MLKFLNSSNMVHQLPKMLGSLLPTRLLHFEFFQFLIQPNFRLFPLEFLSLVLQIDILQKFQPNCIHQELLLSHELLEIHFSSFFKFAVFKLGSELVKVRMVDYLINSWPSFIVSLKTSGEEGMEIAFRMVVFARKGIIFSGFPFALPIKGVDCFFILYVLVSFFSYWSTFHPRIK